MTHLFLNDVPRQWRDMFERPRKTFCIHVTLFHIFSFAAGPFPPGLGHLQGMDYDPPNQRKLSGESYRTSALWYSLQIFYRMNPTRATIYIIYTYGGWAGVPQGAGKSSFLPRKSAFARLMQASPAAAGKRRGAIPRTSTKNVESCRWSSRVTEVLGFYLEVLLNRTLMHHTP